MKRTRKSLRRRITLLIASALGLVVVAGTAFFLLAEPPARPFEPVAWQPGPGLVVPAANVNDAAAATVRSLATTDAPEDVAVNATGEIFVGTKAGTILRVHPESGTGEVFAKVGGRPLGLAFDAHGNLIVANHGLGLQSVSPAGAVTVLADSAAGKPIRSANDLAIGRDGAIYLSDSTAKYNSSTMGDRSSFSLFDFLEGRPQGRVLRYDPASRTATELLSGLYFPNGLIVTSDQRSLLIAESTRYRITRLWLTGEQAGGTEVFLDDVPGIVDGLTLDADRVLAPMYDRVGVLDRYILPSTWTRQAAARIPSSLLQNPESVRSGSILVLSIRGEVLRKYGGFGEAPTNVVPWRDQWLLGTLNGRQTRTMPDPSRERASPR
ncbi:SMP-30/gluconolactonase/LRE family protein [Nonomuraea sp. NPDC046802]|uniref:SMP-30/gluconolactonase/LRE family protein n=1 Tax=Nonomuraea sp. NPDC046802 TaxID=3154919 RepID=UPI0033CA66E5